MTHTNASLNQSINQNTFI